MSCMRLDTFPFITFNGRVLAPHEYSLEYEEVVLAEGGAPAGVEWLFPHIRGCSMGVYTVILKCIHFKTIPKLLKDDVIEVFTKAVRYCWVSEEDCVLLDNTFDCRVGDAIPVT